jgi:hypothetical protein
VAIEGGSIWRWSWRREQWCCLGPWPPSFNQVRLR